jgi:predicted ATP-grasp superfamily ATP-dependent carboligase
MACVIGELDLVQALSLGGIRCAVVAPPGSPVRSSRRVDESIDWLDPWREPEALVERLLAWSRRRDRPALYYDGDWDLLLVSRHREALREGFRFVVADSELVEDLVDKERFQSLAERLDLPVPRRGADAGFPAIAKPLTRQHATWRPEVRAKATVVRSAGELESLRERVGEELLVQEIVPGPESSIESYHCYVDDSGEVVGEFTGRKVRTRPREFGYTTALVITDERDVRELGRGLAARMGLTGVAKFDFKRAPDGRIVLLEVNPRFNLWHHPGAVAGVNLPALVHGDLTGLPRAPFAKARAGVRWVSPRDLQAAREHDVPLRRWLPWALGAEAKSLGSLRDPLPFLRAVFRRDP